MSETHRTGRVAVVGTAGFARALGAGTEPGGLHVDVAGCRRVLPPDGLQLQRGPGKGEDGCRHARERDEGARHDG